MPELDILHGFEFLVLRLKGDYARHHWVPFPARLEIHPEAFAIGTQRKSYESCTVDDSPEFDYQDSLEPVAADYVPRPLAARKAKGKCYSRYLKLLKAGELFVKVRGKEIIFAMGLHAVRVHFGLEGTMIILRTEDYLEIVAQDCPGNNRDPAKAEQMRSFVVPEHLTIPGARKLNKLQTLAIFAAVVGEENTLIMVDHNRLLRLHIMSLSRPWTQADLDPGSLLWPKIWSLDHGPDWIHEQAAAEKALDQWRTSILAAEAKKRAPKGKKALFPPSLLTVICNKQEVFNGYGQHTTHDLLHSLGLWPTMPPAVLCADDKMYEEFKNALSMYARQYITDTYRERCLSTPDPNSPLAYNYKSDDNYLQQFLNVFRKCQIRMPKDEYNKFTKLGLFNPSHIIGKQLTSLRSTLYSNWDNRPRLSMINYHYLGTPYQYTEDELAHVTYKDVTVFQYTCGRNSDPIYSVIRAQRPPHWRYSVASVAVAKDARHAGFQTTIGPASFHAFKQNQYDPEGKGKPGRISIFLQHPK
ncbi:hypothetical protein C8Q78DRAFT_1083646 [Trametes maxima]|nr:hypothetical protein C8Q78DRAFT_1083646 [Trametes maxima]